MESINSLVGNTANTPTNATKPIKKDFGTNHHTRNIIISLIVAFCAVGVLFATGYIDSLASYVSKKVTKEEKPTEVGRLMEQSSALVDISMESIPVAGKSQMQNAIVTDLRTRSAKLKDVTGGDGNGTGYVLRTEQGLMHLVNARLPKPAEGSVYEGWLVDTSKTPVSFFSTGKLEELGVNLYMLEYKTSNPYEGYDFIVITEETKLDETPETHILEGVVGK